MRNFSQKLILFIVFFVIFPGCDRKWTGDITGVLTDSKTSEPIANAVVTAKSMKNSYAISTTTDASGTYRIHDARWGPNRVEAYHPDYDYTTRYADVIRDKTVTLDFEMEFNPRTVAPVIEVYVINSDRDPLEDVRIDLYRKEDVSYDLYTQIASQFTDADGFARFEVSDLLEDQVRFYRMNFSRQGYENTTKSVSISWTDPYPVVTVEMERAS